MAADTQDLPESPGVYLLWFNALETLNLRIGSLGKIEFAPGFYGYCGSARGSGGIAARVRRHLSANGRKHWHVDYLREHLPITDVWYSRTSRNRECLWSAELRKMQTSAALIPGFGASDCRCPGHLHRFLEKPGLTCFQRRLRRVCPGHDRLLRHAPVPVSVIRSG